MRSLRDLTQHLTTRADDSHAAPLQQFLRKGISLYRSTAVQAQVRFFALRRIKPHAPPLVRAPVNSFEFQPLRPYSPGGTLIALATARQGSTPTTPSVHRLQRGLPGYLILFAPHTFVPQRQLLSRWPPSPLVFLHISTHFTATRGILPPSPDSSDPV